jgi:hypothetical protein
MIGEPLYREQNLEKVNWSFLSSNPNAIPILEQHLDKVDWTSLSSNPNAIPILEQHLHKVNWEWLSLNPEAIPLLEQHLDKVDWQWLSKNPNAIMRFFYTLDYEKMFLHGKDFCEELVQTVFHPKRIQRICDTYHMDMADYIKLL